MNVYSPSSQSCKWEAGEVYLIEGLGGGEELMRD